MFYLPIISEKQKKKVDFEFTKRLIFSYIVDVFVIFVIFILLLISLNFLVFTKISMLKKTAELEMVEEIKEEIKNKELSIKDFNKTLLMTNGINSEYFDISNVLYNLSLLIPANVRLYSLQINKETKIFKAQGNVPWRDDILNLQANLEKSGYFTNIDFPLSNFTQKENIDFYFNAKAVEGVK